MEPKNAGGENAADLGDALMRRHSIGIEGVWTARRATPGIHQDQRVAHRMETVRNMMSMAGR